MMMKKPVVIIHETTHETQTHNAHNKVVGDSIAIDTTTTMEPHKTKTANALDRRQESSPSDDCEIRNDGENREVHVPIKVRFGPDLHANNSFDPIQSPRRSSILTSSLKNKPKTSYSRPTVFERLSNYETVASIHRKLESRQIRKRSTSAPPSLRRAFSAPLSLNGNGQQHAKPILPKKDSNSRRDRHRHRNRNGNKKEDKDGHRLYKPTPTSQLSFQRLAVRHTKLSKIRQRRPRAASTSEKEPPKNSFQRGRVRRVSRVRSTSRGRFQNIDLQNVNDVNAQNVNVNANVNANVNVNAIRATNSNFEVDEQEHNEYLEQKRFDDELSSVAAMSVPFEIEFTSRMQLYTVNTHKPEDGYNELDPTELQLNSSLAEYEAGGLSVKELASEIVSTLLLRDLHYDVDWSMQAPLYRDLALPLGEVGFSFFIEAAEEVDGSNGNESGVNASASATGNIVFIHDLAEIHIENYSFVSDEIRLEEYEEYRNKGED